MLAQREKKAMKELRFVFDSEEQATGFCSVLKARITRAETSVTLWPNEAKSAVVTIDFPPFYIGDDPLSIALVVAEIVTTAHEHGSYVSK